MPGRHPCGYGSRLNHQGTAGFSPCVHLPPCHFGGTLFDPHPCWRRQTSIPRAVYEAFCEPTQTAKQGTLKNTGTFLLGLAFHQDLSKAESRDPRSREAKVPASPAAFELRSRGACEKTIGREKGRRRRGGWLGPVVLFYFSYTYIYIYIFRQIPGLTRKSRAGVGTLVVFLRLASREQAFHVLNHDLQF